MKKSTHNFLFLPVFVLCCLFYGCAAPPQPMGENAPYISKTFPKEYDEVWEATEGIVADDLMIPIKEKDKARGIIRTDWVSIIRIRGILRWNMKILLERGENNTTVKIYDHVEEPFSEKEAVGKMKKKDKISTGWQKSQEKIPEVNEILNMLSSRLGE